MTDTTTPTVAALREALKWAMPLARIAMESHRWERIKNGHNHDITCTAKSGERWIGLYQSEYDEMEAHQATLNAALTAPPSVPEGGMNWQDGATAPEDGSEIIVGVTYRYTLYKPDGQRQMRAKGRWQCMGEFGWENCAKPERWLSRLASPPREITEERPVLRFDEKARLGYVWLVWGLNIAPPRCDLIAIATTHAARTNYLQMGKQCGFDRVHSEKAFVNHAYGDGDLTRYLDGRAALAYAAPDRGKE